MGTQISIATTDTLPTGRTTINSNFTSLHTHMGYNVLAPPVGLAACVGDANQTSGGTNDAPALQAIIDASILPGGPGLVIIPGTRDYALSSTITIPVGCRIVGLGGRNGEDSGSPPKIIWQGALNGVQFDIANPYNNVPSTSVENLMFMGRTNGSNWPAHHIQVRGTGGFVGSPDSGCYLKDIWFGGCRSHGLEIGFGATNFWMCGCRWDGAGGIADGGPGGAYGIHVNMGGQFNLHLFGCSTWTSNEDQGNAGFLWLDTEGDSGGGQEASVQIDSLHLEIGSSLQQSYSGGTNPYDRRGIFRLGVSEDIGNVSHNIVCNNLRVVDPGTSINSYCIFQITAAGGTDVENAKMVNLIVDSGTGLGRGSTESAANGEIRIIGGRIPTNMRPPVSVGKSGRWGRFQWGIGKNASAASGFEHVSSWTHSHNNYVDYPIVGPIGTYANLTTVFAALKKGMRAWVTDGTSANTNLHTPVTGGGGSYDGPVYWTDANGGEWRIG